MSDGESGAVAEVSDEELGELLNWYRQMQDTMPRVLELQKAILDKTLGGVRRPGGEIAVLSTLSCNSHSCN